ncbi:hypothetical protein SBRCBS47491_001046 [Sporothrix bragantina]|uniref:DUF3074 domain-containing protein n=1 Tax=Sporothrix bragantina TaxID=671064 RepID=A0ABP0AVC8_9PEZI
MVRIPSCHPLGPLLRLEGLDYNDLPPIGTSRNRIEQFMMALLQESLQLIGSVDTYYANVNQKRNPSGWKSKGKQTYRGVSKIGGPGEVVVDLLERSISKSELKDAIEKPALVQADHGVNASGSNTGTSASGSNPDPNVVTTRVMGKKNPTPETWACRRSLHRNEAAAGTADWDEFIVRMKDLHVETEKDMTPTVPRAQKVHSWPAAGLVDILELPGYANNGPGPWTGFTLNMVEMEHDLNTLMLKNRIFPVLQMTCRTLKEADLHQMLVVSIPINNWKDCELSGDVTTAKYASESNKVIGSYASVERFRIVERVEEEPRPAPVSKLSRLTRPFRGRMRPSATASAAVSNTPPPEASSSATGSGGAGSSSTAPAATGQRNAASAQALVQGPAGGANVDKIQHAPAVDYQGQNGSSEAESPEVNEMETQIEWTMATASHARGWLPLFIQTPAVPKKIAIDVPLFLKFIQKMREQNAGEQIENEDRQADQQAVSQSGANPPVEQSANNPPAGNSQSG